MNSKFLPFVSLEKIKNALASGNDDELYDLLIQPLHEELFRRNTFDFIDDLSQGQQLMLAYDYLRMQVGQGGFIQFIENGYIGLLPAMVEQLFNIGDNEMARDLDDVLKVYVLNKDIFNAAKSLEDFANLYDELIEFEGLDSRFNELNNASIKLMLAYALAHLDEFITS